LHILCLTHAYPRRDGDVAGAFIERLNVALMARGHRVQVIAPSDEGRGGRDQQQGIPVERVRYAPPERETLAYSGTMTQAAKSLRGVRDFRSLIGAMGRAVTRATTAEAVDLVHAHWWLPGGIAASQARRRGGPRYVVTLHGTDVAIANRSWLARLIARRVLTRALSVTAVSSFLAESMRAAAHYGRPIAVAPMPADVQPCNTLPRGGGGIVTVGRLTKQKRIGLLLDAVSRLPDRSIALTVVGDGPERSNLERQATRLGLAERVRFIGAVAPQRVADLISSGDVFAFPAKEEGFGLAAAEALALGLPVVATTDGGGVLDFMSSEVGAVVPPDAEQLAQALNRVASDPSVRGRAAAAGATLAERLSAANAAEAYEAVYRAAAEGAL